MSFRNNIKRFFEKLFEYCKFGNKKILNDLDNDSNQIITDNKNNMELEFVIPGHYCTKGSINDEVKSIIRVLGPDPKKKGHWRIDSGKSISENIILDDYVLLDTKPTDKSVKSNKNIMKDFKPTNSPNQPDEDDEDVGGYEGPDSEVQDLDDTAPYVRQIPKHLLPDQIPVKAPEPTPSPKQKLKIYSNPSVTNILQKATVNQLNINYEKKYGTRPYKTTKITVPVTIEIPYVLDKLSQICELFELSLDEVAQSIYVDLDLPEQLIISKIKDALMPKTFTEPEIDNSTVNEPEKVETEIKQETKQIQEQKIIEEKQSQLQDGINEVDNYLKNMFS